MNPETNWLSRMFSSRHRRASRHAASGLVAYYWEGTAPVGHPIQNISSTGFYLLTKERWLPGTVLTMTLQKAAVAGSTPELYIAVQTKVVRLDKDGVGLSFIQLEPQGAQHPEEPSSKPAGKRALHKFLEQLLSEQGHVTVAVPERDIWQEGRARLASSGGSAMKTLREENGQALVITVLSMTILLGFSALAADVGIMLKTKRIAQTAADAGAIAGASVIKYGGDATAAAKAATALNGMTDGANGATITVNNPPLYGPHAGATNTAYVEVIASQVEPTIFMNLFGFSNLTINTRAVAYNGSAGYNCVYVLNQSAPDSAQFQGSFNFNAPNCGVIVDSTDPCALDFTGSGGTLTAGSVGVTGGDCGKTGDSTPAPVIGVAPESDPLAAQGITPPDTTKLTCTAAPTPPATGTLTIGPTDGGTVCYSGAVDLNNMKLSPGTYVFTGTTSTLGPCKSTVCLGNLTTDTTAFPHGVTLDIANGSLGVDTNTTIDLVAPHPVTGDTASDPYNGIVIMQPLDNTNQLQLQFGSSFGTVDGIIWAPGAQLYLQDSGGDSKGGVTLITDLIVNTMFDKTTAVTINSYTQSTSTSPLTKVSLVE